MKWLVSILIFEAIVTAGYCLFMTVSYKSDIVFDKQVIEAYRAEIESMYRHRGFSKNPQYTCKLK